MKYYFKFFSNDPFIFLFALISLHIPTHAAHYFDRENEQMW